MQDNGSRLAGRDNQVFEIAAISDVGDRQEQQDCFGYVLKNTEGIIIVCDGMGGHQGGERASNTAVNTMLGAYNDEKHVDDIKEFLIQTTEKSDADIFSLTDEKGKKLNAGSTQVAIVIRNNDLYWCSVGDSRAYLFRNGEFLQITVDQNYLTVLKEKLTAGTISNEEFEKEKYKGEALINFLGIGNISFMDYSQTPLKLLKDDRVLIATDGIYKLINDDEMGRIIGNFNNIEDALYALLTKVKGNGAKQRISRDNATAVLIKIK